MGRKVITDYDADNLLTNRISIPNLFNTEYNYDKDRRLIQTNFPSGKQIKNVYTNAQLTQIRTPQLTDRIIVCYRIGDPEGNYPIYDASGSMISPGR